MLSNLYMYDMTNTDHLRVSPCPQVIVVPRPVKNLVTDYNAEVSEVKMFVSESCLSEVDICLSQVNIVHGLASFVQQNSKIGGHSNPFGGSSITYVGSVCHQSRVIWRCGAHSALTSWSRWFYTVKWSKLAIFSGLSGRFLGVVWWFQSFLLVRTCLYLDDQVRFWKKI